MRKLVYYIGVSIDGRIAGPGGEADFYPVGEGEAAAAYVAWVNERYPETVSTQYRPHANLADVPNKRYPVIAGAGAALVEGGFDPTAFTTTDHRSFFNGAGITWYARRAGA
ncbi:hypothetical protein ACFHW2_25110 [Actinomadura sp. LOL_016]|uniref:hypothetical protein n=1 Tax=unclassified Actinomadura TaxID=2626254 RepID=UPI003A808640